MGIGFMPAYRGRSGRISDEVSVMETKPRAWLVRLSNNQKLKAISGWPTTLKPNSNPLPKIGDGCNHKEEIPTLRSSTRKVPAVAGPRRMKGDFHVRFRGKVGMKFPCVT
jgi:ribosomal protein L21E